jgi:hypothetical protein
MRALKSDSAPPCGSAWEPASQNQRRDVCASRAWSVGMAVVGEGVEKALGWGHLPRSAGYDFQKTAGYEHAKCGRCVLEGRIWKIVGIRRRKRAAYGRWRDRERLGRSLPVTCQPRFLRTYLRNASGLSTIRSRPALWSNRFSKPISRCYNILRILNSDYYDYRPS